MVLTSRSVDDTLRLGQIIGRLATPGTVIALHGQLGAGKTQLARGIAQGAKVEDHSLVCSPTYVLLNIYPGPKPVYHMDAYRIFSEEDFDAVGLEEIFRGQNDAAQGITIIEWPERIPHLLPDDRLEITLEPDSESTRTLTLFATGGESKHLAGLILAAAG